jgi:hypothetical protein
VRGHQDGAPVTIGALILVLVVALLVVLIVRSA